MGFANVNGLLKQGCAPAETLSRQQRLEQVSTSCYSQFLEDHAQDWSKRMMLKVEYSKSDGYHLDLPDDEVRNDDRLVATLSYIQKMSESSSASLSLIYANKPELVGEVDQEVSAHVGLKLKMDTKADTKADS
jgi:hypothetical protein